MSLKKAIQDAAQIRKTGEGIKSHDTLPGLLIFGVVAADLMSTPMYVVGLLAKELQNQQWIYLFLLWGLLGLLLPFYWMVMVRHAPEGGGVTSLAEKAFHPFVGQIGAWMMVSAYALTVAISAASAVYYLTSFFPDFPKNGVIGLTVSLIGFLWYLNILGVKESAGVALKATIFTLCTYGLVVVLSAMRLDSSHVAQAKKDASSVFLIPAAGWGVFLIMFFKSFASAFLALTGLESGAQIAHHVREPRGKHAGVGLFLVWIVFLLTPMLGFMAAYVLDLYDPAVKAKGDYLLALLAQTVGGKPLEVVFIISGSLILAFAANTGMIGYNAVLMHLAQIGSLPRGLLKTGKKGTPVISVTIVGITSALIVLAVNGEMETLGHLYAFGVVGSVALTMAAVLKVRVMDEKAGKPWVNILLLIAVIFMAVIFVFNLIYKVEAAILGTLVVIIGVALTASNRKYGKGVEVAITRSLAPVASRVVHGHLQEHKLDVIGDSIVVATRGGAIEVVKMAAELAALRGAELYLLYVCESPVEWRPADWTPADDPRGQRVLEEASTVASEYGITPHPVHVVAGSAGVAILELIHAVNCKMLVMGLPTRGRLERLVRGDVVKFVESRRPTDLHIMYYSP